MTMEPALHVTLTRTRRGEPLACVDGLPGGGADLTPAQLRALARALEQAAADCEAGRVRRVYPLETAPAGRR